MIRQPIDLPPILSVEFIQISDETNIPFAPKARKIIEKVKEKMEQSLLNIISVQSLEQDLEILVKALECRQADIKKAEDTGAEYFIKLLGNMQEASKDLESIKIGLVKIKQYSE